MSLSCGGRGRKKEKRGMGFLAFLGIAGPSRRPARRAISSVVERAPDNCVVVPGLRIDGAIQVRSNVDPTFYSLVGSGRSGGDHHGSSLLENPYIPYQCMDSYLSSAGLGSASMGK
uniref:Uncharacterized protein ycf68 n=1 Tax=Brassica campestris TaxID=3711 RepID=A0A3P6DL39_BRACM|nr:unnamed protein product [Brassica rapa]